MNLTEITSNLAASLAELSSSQSGSKKASSNSASSTSNTDAITNALNKSTQRLTDQRQQTQVKLSAFGQIKSAVSDLQLASRNLSATGASSTEAAAAKAAQTFVDAFNNANKVASAATKPDDKKTTEVTGALTNDGRARSTANELSRALSNVSSTGTSTSASDLKAIGITTNSNGTLSFDAKKFSQAYQAAPSTVTSTLSEAGQRVDRVTSRQLEGNGNINRSVSALTTQVKSLENQESEQKARVDAFQQASQQTNTRLDQATASSIATYQQIFSL